MIDCIEPLALLVVLTMLVATWLYLGIRDRRRARRAASRSPRVRPFLCGDSWRVGTVEAGVDWFMCTRPYEHSGPCLDGLKGVIRR